MGNLRKTLGLDKNRPKSSPPPAKQPTAKPQQPQKAAQPPVKGEIILHTCGHSVVFEEFPNEKPDFRKRRMEKDKARFCKACRDKANAERLAEDERKKAERIAKRRADHESRSWGTGWKSRSSTNLARLPDGSKFRDLIYSARTKTWSGYLDIPSCGEVQTFFVEGATAAMKLLSLLDDKYRDWLDAKDGKSPPVMPPAEEVHAMIHKIQKHVDDAIKAEETPST